MKKYIVPIILLFFILVAVPDVSAQTPVCPPLPTDTGTVTSSLSITQVATYTIWSRIKAPDSTNNSYYLQIDSQCGVKVGDAAIPTNTWTWVNYQNGNTSSPIQIPLSSGTHVVKLIGAEPNVGVDRLLFLTDASCIPTGTGDSCLQTPTITQPLTSPGTSITFTPSIQVSPTAMKVKGDYNNSGTVDILDFNLWRDEFTGVKSTRMSTTIPMIAIYFFKCDEYTICSISYSLVLVHK